MFSFQNQSVDLNMEDKNVNKIHRDYVKVKACRIEVSLKWGKEDIIMGRNPDAAQH